MKKKENLENEYLNYKLKDFFFKYGLRFIIITAISLVILITYVSIKLFSPISFVDGLFIGGLVGVLVSGCSFVTNHGFFDIFAYNAIRFINFVKQYKEKNYYGTYEYTKAKEPKRKEARLIPLSYFISGCCFLLASLIVYLVLFF